MPMHSCLSSDVLVSSVGWVLSDQNRIGDGAHESSDRWSANQTNCMQVICGAELLPSIICSFQRNNFVQVLPTLNDAAFSGSVLKCTTGVASSIFAFKETNAYISHFSRLSTARRIAQTKSSCSLATVGSERMVPGDQNGWASMDKD